MPKAIDIVLDKPRKLRFDINALSDAEEALGMGLGALMRSQMGVRAIRALLWAGLKWEDRGLTLEKTGDIVQKHIESGGNLEGLGESISRALLASGLFDSEDEDDEKNTKAEAAK